MIVWMSYSEDDTIKFGKWIGKNSKPGDIILLYGDLGSGKTAISKGIAWGAGFEDIVTSPTFALMNQYNGKYPIYHFDIYRLSHPEDLYDLDYEEYFFGDGITLVEWPERMGDLIPEQYLKITLEKVEDFNQREIMIELVGNRYKPYEEVLSKYDSISY